MNDLPSRHEAKRFVFSTFTDDSDALVPAIVRAYAVGDLKTQEEWLDTLVDYEAAFAAAGSLALLPSEVDRIIAAALGGKKV